MTSIEPTTTPATSPATVTIRAARVTDSLHVTELLTAAFLHSAVGDWLIPDLAIRRAVYRRYFRIHVDHALRHGFIDISLDGNGAAVWLPRPGHDPDNYEQLLAEACGTWLRRFELIDELFTRHHPTARHHHLAFLGVRPDRQREGIGSALLADHTTALDAKQIPAYLDASTPHSRDLYLRHGFHVVDTGPIRLPEDGPPIWPMWRPPTSTGTAPVHATTVSPEPPR